MIEPDLLTLVMLAIVAVALAVWLVMDIAKSPTARKIAKRIRCRRLGHDWQTRRYTPSWNYQECADCGADRRAAREW